MALVIKRKAWLSGLAALAISAGAQAVPEKVGDFGLIDHQGEQHQVTRLGHQKALVVISQSNSCSDTIENLHRYKLLRSTWEAKGVKFLMINADQRDNLDSIRNTASIYDIDFPIMYDDSQLVAQSLDIAQAGEVLIIDPDTRELLFHGPLDTTAQRGKPETGTTYIADALANITSEAPAKAETVKVEIPSNSCDIAYTAETAKHTPDYATEVAPIFKENCAHCHVQGGIGPFAMDSYAMVRGFAPMIRETLMTKRMPPAQVDPYVSHFDNANYMDIKDLQTLVHWIDAGAPRGDSKNDPLTTIQPVDVEWQLGEPDMIVEVPAFTVPATGVLDYFNNEIDLGFEEDKFVRAVQFIPGDKRVLHHLLAYINSPSYDRAEVLSEENIRDFLEGYAPGKTDVTVFPEGTGVMIPKGHKLVMQMHYTTFGKEVVDKTRVGLWFHDETPDYKFLTKSVSLGGPNLVIEPNDIEHKMNFQHVFEHDMMLYALRPHMHYRGKSFRFSVIYPDGKRETLMNVPNYNFAWQPTYRLSEPKFLPAGSRVITDGVFDNSEYNPGNPDPNVTVKGGAQSWDEMFIGYFTYTDLGDGTTTGQSYLSKKD